MEPLSGDKLFRLLTGETDQSLRPGKEVTGKVVRNGDFGSRVKLEGDIPAFIALRNLADEHVEAAEDVVTVGSVVTAIVTEVKKDHITVDLSLRMEDFRKPPTSWERPNSLQPIDVHFDRAAAIQIEEEKSQEREARLNSLQLSLAATRIGDDPDIDGQPKKRGGRVTRRACAHPAFRNAKNNEVDHELIEAGEAMVGEALIRPSSKSSDSLAIHWVVRLGHIKVIEVTEEDKDTDASIGNILKIKVRIVARSA
jgi:transcription elongation factor SPT6